MHCNNNNVKSNNVFLLVYGTILVCCDFAFISFVVLRNDVNKTNVNINLVGPLICFLTTDVAKAFNLLLNQTYIILK